MTTLLSKAAKGNRRALTALYEQNKQTVFYLCQQLYPRKSDAANATAWVFRNSWATVLDGKIDSEEDFFDFVCKKAASYCKKQLLKKDSKALKVPANKSFLIHQIDSARISRDSDKLSTLLQLMPDFQRYILILRVMSDMDADEIACILNTDKSVVRLAQDAEISNLARIYDAVNKVGGNSLPATKELLAAAFRDAVSACHVPRETDILVQKSIDVIALPIERKARKRNNLIGAICAVAVLVIILIPMAFSGGADDGVSDSDGTIVSDTTSGDPTEESGGNGDSNGVTVAGEEINVTCYADITIEDYGTITVALDGDAAPVTVANFVDLAESGFYDGLTFHRIIEGFMMQGGDPEGDGTGGSEETIAGEFSANGYENTLSHTRGAISMARSSDYDSASSQFFIVHEDSTDSLDGLYACFGYVTEGMDVVDAICEAAEPTDDNGAISAENQPVITSILIRDAEAADAE